MLPFMQDKKKLAGMIMSRVKMNSSGDAGSGMEDREESSESKPGLDLANEHIAAVESKDPKRVMASMQALHKHFQGNPVEEESDEALPNKTEGYAKESFV